MNYLLFFSLPISPVRRGKSDGGEGVGEVWERRERAGGVEEMRREEDLREIGEKK